MGVKVISRKYIGQFAPASDPIPDWLLGESGDWITARLELEAGIDYIASQSQPLQIDKEAKTIKLMDGSDWGEHGFDIGQTVTMHYKITETEDDGPPDVSEYTFDFDIVQIYGDTIEYAASADLDAIPFDMIPTERGDLVLNEVKMFAEIDLQGIRMKYTNIENGQVDSHTLNSVIDGTQTEMIFAGLDTMPNGVYQDMELVGLQSGMAIHSARIRKGGEPQTVDAAWQIFNANSQTVQIPPGQKRRAKSLATFKNQGSTPPYKNSLSEYIPATDENFGTYENAVSANCFIEDATVSGTRFYTINAPIVIVTFDNAGPSRFVQLCLFKFGGTGSGRPFISKQVLHNYQPGNSYFGLVQNFTDVIEVNVEEGCCYAIGLEYATDILGSSTKTLRFKSLPGGIAQTTQSTETTYIKRYVVDIRYMIASFWDNVEDVANRQPPQALFNQASLTDSFEIKFFPEWNNPNVVVKNDPDKTERLGTTGWFEENFNGLPNDFTVKSVTYQDGGGAYLPGLSYAGETRVKAVIGNVPNIGTGGGTTTTVQYGFCWLPQNESQYKNKTTPFHKNVKINSPENEAFQVGQAYPAVYQGFSEDGLARMDAKNVMVYAQGSDLVWEATFSPTADFAAYFGDTARDQDRNYFLWLSVADRDLVVNFSDRVALILDVNVMENYVPISGSIAGMTGRFLEHPEDSTMPGVELYNGFLEDDLLAVARFNIEPGKKIQQVIMGYEVENIDTGLTLELDRSVANTSQYPVTPADNIHQVDFNGERGFKYAPDFDKNWIKVIRAPQSDINGNPAYEIYFGAKIRWERWLQRANALQVAPEFYDNTLPFNGATNNWLDYLRNSNNHRINFFTLIDLIEGGVTRRYKNTFEIDFGGYDERTDIITTEHNYKDAATGASLNLGPDPVTGRPLGILLGSANTLVEIIYTKVAGNFDLENVYAVTTIEVDGGEGYMAHRIRSSIVDSEFDDPLVPVAGFSKLKVELLAPGNKIKTSCLVDFSKLPRAPRFKITGRIGCFRNANGVPIRVRKYEDRYEQKYE